MTDKVTWHTSSYSVGESNCVEVAEGATTLVRDAQNRDRGHIALSPGAWTAFLRSVKKDDLDGG